VGTGSTTPVSDSKCGSSPSGVWNDKEPKDDHQRNDNVGNHHKPERAFEHEMLFDFNPMSRTHSQSPRTSDQPLHEFAGFD